MEYENPHIGPVSGSSISRVSAVTVVEMIGPCTGDIADCEIVRAAIANKDAAPDDEIYVQAIRAELAKAACRDCAECYLPNADTEA